jgi:predicted  nucleic acid-binding Zn-ribbon protein
MWGLGALVLLLAGNVHPFRAEPQAQNPDTMKELLVEVRGLRAAMEQLASAGPRVQLMFGRLQLQEQRVNEQMRTMDALRAQLTKAQEEESSQRSQIQRFEDAVQRGNLPAEERKDLEESLPQMRRHLSRLVLEVQKFQVEEANLSSLIATEQNRWTDINRALDELDRALTRR